jgi:hypothetical protein
MVEGPMNRYGLRLMLLIHRVRIRQLWGLQVRYAARHRHVLRELDRQLDAVAQLIERLDP